MSKANIFYAALVVVFMAYYTYTVFLADDALVNRTQVTYDESGGYEVVTKRPDGSKIVEIYEVDANSSPKSHTLMLVGSEPASEPKVLKKGTFVPKFKKET